MRIIHDDLITSQQSGTANPYIYLEINSIDYSSRLISLQDVQEPYRDTATIVLANSDRYFDGVNLLGKSFTIGYGYVTDSGNRYCGDSAGSEATPTLWVKSQSMVSMEGKAVCILYCEGCWMRLREYNYVTGGTLPYFEIKHSIDSVYTLMGKALAEAGFTLNALGAGDDGIINDLHPLLTINPFVYENPAAILYRLIQMTMTYLRGVEGSAFEVVYPQSADGVNETYYSDQAPYFKEYVEKLDLLVPNHIVVYANRDRNTGVWNTTDYPLIIGHYRDPDQFELETAGSFTVGRSYTIETIGTTDFTLIGATSNTVGVKFTSTGTGSGTGTAWGYTASYGEVIEYWIAPYLDNQTDADNRAMAILQRYRNETLAGRAVLPFHDCRVEMYDRVAIEDNRGL